MRLSSLLLLTTAIVFAAPAGARDPATPEQRIQRLEKQVRQVQKQVFPKGEPADTAGFSDDPAATQAGLDALTGRLDAVERQMADLTRQAEENGHRLSVVEADLARTRADQDRRFRELESGPATPASGEPATIGTAPAKGDAAEPAKPATTTQQVSALPYPRDANFDTAAEQAYDQGYNLWNSGQYDQAITVLKAMATSFPGHRRVSWANNLVGRALLDKGQPRAAAEVLLANYRGNPKGERAPDSLFYLGQALVKLKQSGQACKAYSELSDVYATTMRAQLKAMIPTAMAEAKCS